MGALRIALMFCRSITKEVAVNNSSADPTYSCSQCLATFRSKDVLASHVAGCKKRAVVEEEAEVLITPAPAAALSTTVAEASVSNSVALDDAPAPAAAA